MDIWTPLSVSFGAFSSSIAVLPGDAPISATNLSYNGFPFNKKRLATWESNVNREGWKAKPGISKLCEVGVDIILRRSRSLGVAVAVGSTTVYTVIRNFSCKQTRHMFPYDA